MEERERDRDCMQSDVDNQHYHLTIGGPHGTLWVFGTKHHLLLQFVGKFYL